MFTNHSQCDTVEPEAHTEGQGENGKADSDQDSEAAAASDWNERLTDHQHQDQ